MVNTIKSVFAGVINDSSGKDTVRVEIIDNHDNKFWGAVPAGQSVGASEAKTVGIGIALDNVNTKISKVLYHQKLDDIYRLDNILLELDGTPTKINLGANAILPTSIAMTKAISSSYGYQPWKYISYATSQQPKIPLPMMVMIEGGKHGKFPGVDWQEFLLNGSTKNGLEFLLELKDNLRDNQIDYDDGVEGGISVDVKNNGEALKIFLDVFEKSKYYESYSLDLAGSHNKTTLPEIEGLINDKNLYSIEDPFDQEDWQTWIDENKNFNGNPVLIGDDLTTTNLGRLNKAINNRACSGIIIKPNQIGSVSETLEVVKLAKKNKIKCIVSHRAGETMDTFIADLAVGIGAEHLKSGAPTKKERKIKYDRVAMIKKELEGNGINTS